MQVPKYTTDKIETDVLVQAQKTGPDTPKAFVPATIAGVVAAIGMAGFVFIAFGPGNDLQGRGDGMISAAAANSVGATITPTVTSR